MVISARAENCSRARITRPVSPRAGFVTDTATVRTGAMRTTPLVMILLVMRTLNSGKLRDPRVRVHSRAVGSDTSTWLLDGARSCVSYTIGLVLQVGGFV